MTKRSSPTSLGLAELVQEFRDEYLEHTLTLGEDAFIAGLLFPAIPVWIEKGIGIDIVYSYLNQIKR